MTRTADRDKVLARNKALFTTANAHARSPSWHWMASAQAGFTGSCVTRSSPPTRVYGAVAFFNEQLP
jgi:hypothetical protein